MNEGAQDGKGQGEERGGCGEEGSRKWNEWKAVRERRRQEGKREG